MVFIIDSPLAQNSRNRRLRAPAMPAPSLSNCAAFIATRRRFPPPCPDLALLPALLLFLFAASVALGATDAETIVIERDEIRALNVQRVADILNTVPGVRAGDTSVSIRGSSRVRVLLDGRPINDPTSSHGRINFDFITPDAIERIEILPGRGALRYGDDASGGVILITSRAAGRVRGDIRVHGGSQDTVRADGKLRWRKDGWALDGALGREQTDGYQVNDDRSRERIRARVSRDSDRVRSTLLVSGLREDRGIPGRPEYPTPRARRKRKMFSSAINLTAGAHTSDTFLNRADTANTNPEKNLDTFITVTELGEDLATSTGRTPLGTISAGLGGRWGRADASGFSGQEEHSLFLFLSDTWSPKHLPLQVSAGVRATAYSAFTNTVNPECRIILGGKTDQLALSWSRSTNTPSFYQRFSETSTRLPNPDLGTETADNFALSLATAWGKALSLDLALFSNRISDRITYVLADTGVGRYENFGRVSYRGLDLQLTWRPVAGFSIRTAYSHLRAIDDNTGLWLVAKPRHRLNTDFEYQGGRLPLSCIFNVRYESRQATRSDNTAWAPQRWLFGVRTEYRHSKRLRFFAEIRNLANITYLYGGGSLAPPRTWLAGIQLSF